VKGEYLLDLIMKKRRKTSLWRRGLRLWDRGSARIRSRRFLSFYLGGGKEKRYVKIPQLGDREGESF